MIPHWPQPSHPDVLEVVSRPGSFSSYSRATTSFPPGALLARLTAPTLTMAERAYSSVQVGANESVELNCDFLYINHSCEPNIEFRVLGSEKLNEPDVVVSGSEHPVTIEIRVVVARRQDTAKGSEEVVGLRQGEPLTFFYPSSEWDMAQGFDCLCGTAACKGFIRGAKYLGRDELKPYFINDHIWRLKVEQEQQDDNQGSSGDVSASVSSKGTTEVSSPAIEADRG